MDFYIGHARFSRLLIRLELGKAAAEPRRDLDQGLDVGVVLSVLSLQQPGERCGATAYVLGSSTNGEAALVDPLLEVLCQPVSVDPWRRIRSLGGGG